VSSLANSGANITVDKNVVLMAESCVCTLVSWIRPCVYGTKGVLCRIW